MNRSKFSITLISMLSVLTIMSVAFAADLSVENKVISPVDKTIWTTDSKENPKEATVVLTITNLVDNPGRTPLDVVLAIDSSGSLGNATSGAGTDPDSRRVDAAKEFIDNLNSSSDQVGVVLWNDTVIGAPFGLTNNFAEAKSQLEKSDSQGFTCIWMALNASMNLLKNSRPNAKKVIVIFSDGNDTCRTPLDFKGLATQIRQSGVEIYAIGLGDSKVEDLQALGSYYHVSDSEAIPAVFQEVAATILGSLKNVQVKYLLPTNVDLSAPSETVNLAQSNSGNMLIWGVGSMLPRETKTLTFKVSSGMPDTYTLGMAPDSMVTYAVVNNSNEMSQLVPPTVLNVANDPEFFYAGSGKGGVVNDPIPFDPNDPSKVLNVVISKDIRLPNPGDPGCQNIVICVNTPPISIGAVTVLALDSSGSMQQQGDTDSNKYCESMMNGIGYALSQNSKLVEYARVDWDAGYYTPDYSNVSITGRSNDVMASGIDYSGKFQPASNWSAEPAIFCEEYEGTFYKVGLDHSASKLINEYRNSNNLDKERKAWFGIFIAGMSEVIRGDIDPALDLLKSYNMPMYTIGVRISPDRIWTDNESASLKEIAEKTGGEYYLDVQPNDIGTAVDKIIKKELNKKGSSIYVARNITVTETIYPYLKVVGTSMPAKVSDNKDGTTTLVFNPGDMAGNQMKCITINTALDLNKLPVDVNSKKTSVDFSPETSTPPSTVAYRSELAIDKVNRVKELPEGELSIFCGEPCVCPEVPQASEVVQEKPTPAGAVPAATETSKTPGFEILAAVLGLTATAYAARRR